jgi:hypothetical protein
MGIWSAVVLNMLGNWPPLTLQACPDTPLL